MSAMSRIERVKAVLAGERPDRPVVSFWRHFFREESSAEGLAEAMLVFQREYDWDFMKVNPRAGYHAEPWGARFAFHDDDHQGPTLQEPAVKSPEDWAKLEPLDPDHGALGEHLEALGRIRDGLNGEVPFMMTLFSPLSIAARMVGSDETMREHLDNAPEAVERGLEIITTTYRRFTEACLEVGCCGLYYATTGWGRGDRMSWEEFENFSRPYDMQILDALDERAWFNILHVCGPQCFLDKLLDYPVQALSWDVTDATTPNLADVAGQTDKTLVGGVTQGLMAEDGNREQILAEAQAALDATGGRGWMLGAGCCVPTQVTDGNLRALRDWAAMAGA